MPVVGKPDKRGDLYATIDVQLPRSLTKEQREHYEALSKLGVLRGQPCKRRAYDEHSGQRGCRAS